MAIRSRAGSTAAGCPARGGGLGRGEPGGLEDGGLGDARVARGARDPAPVRRRGRGPRP